MYNAGRLCTHRNYSTFLFLRVRLLSITNCHLGSSLGSRLHLFSIVSIKEECAAVVNEQNPHPSKKKKEKAKHARHLFPLWMVRSTSWRSCIDCGCSATQNIPVDFTPLQWLRGLCSRWCSSRFFLSKHWLGKKKKKMMTVTVSRFSTRLSDP